MGAWWGSLVAAGVKTTASHARTHAWTVFLHLTWSYAIDKSCLCIPIEMDRRYNLIRERWMNKKKRECEFRTCDDRFVRRHFRSFWPQLMGQFSCSPTPVVVIIIWWDGVRVIINLTVDWSDGLWRRRRRRTSISHQAEQVMRGALGWVIFVCACRLAVIIDRVGLFRSIYV